MAWSTAEQLILESGKSAELISAFRLVAEVTSAGTPKYSAKTCRQLARVISCRSYAPAVLELCHLVVVAETCGAGRHGYEAFFWNSGAARTQNFAALVRQQVAAIGSEQSLIIAENDKVELNYPDGRFAIAYGRMPFLSALMEFLVTTVGYCDIDDLWSAMLRAGPSNQGVSATANRVSKILYGYLAEHLPSAQNQRKFACLVDYLGELEGGDFAAETIDDEVILEFWVAHSGREGPATVDFRTYSSVFRAFASLRQALDEAGDLEVRSPTKTIGYDREAGEVDPAEVARLLETTDDVPDVVAALRDGPASAIKFMTQAEIRVFEKIIAIGSSARALPLSVMRCEIFGAIQSRLSQARRRKLSREDLCRLIDDGPKESYQDRHRRLRQVSEQAEKILLACLYALTLIDAKAALALLVELRPDLDFSDLARALQDRDHHDTVVPLREAVLAAQADRVLTNPGLMGEAIARVFIEARKAFRSVNRRGFSEDCAVDPDLAEGFLRGAQILLWLRQHLVLFCELLGRVHLPDGNWDRQFQSDLGVFRRQFHVLYGDSQ